MYKTFVSYAQWFWENFVINYPGAILLGGVAGGIVAAVISLLQWRGAVARHLLSEVLRIQAMVEAWIVVGDGWKTYQLNRNNLLPTTKNFSDDGPLAVYPVEIRLLSIGPSGIRQSTSSIPSSKVGGLGSSGLNSFQGHPTARNRQLVAKLVDDLLF